MVAGVLIDPMRKELAEIASDCVRFVRAKGERPLRYFHCFGYRTGAMAAEEFLSLEEHRRIRSRLLRSPAVEVLEDKAEFKDYMEGGDRIRTAPIVGIVHGGSLKTVTGLSLPFSSIEEVSRALRHTVSHTDSTRFFLKPVRGAYGRGVSLADIENAADILNVCAEGDYLIECAIDQHPDLKVLHPPSVNSMRMVSCKRKGQGPLVTNAWLRIGRGGNIIDNTGAGGLVAEVDLTSGNLTSPVTNKFSAGGRIFSSHPDTGIKFVDVRVPYIREAVEMVGRAAERVDHPLIGWDVAIDIEGPVLIEGNHASDPFAWEAAAGGFRHIPALSLVIDELLD